MDYLLHGIPWATVQRMLIDAPAIDDEADGQPLAQEFALTDDNAAEVLQMINSINR